MRTCTSGSNGFIHSRYTCLAINVIELSYSCINIIHMGNMDVI